MAILQMDRALLMTFRARVCQWTLTTHKARKFKALLWTCMIILQVYIFAEIQGSVLLLDADDMQDSSMYGYSASI